MSTGARTAEPAPVDARLPGARGGFTRRDGGVSAGSYASLNLAHHVGDEEAAVRRNRALLAGVLEVPVVYADQVHSADVAVLGEGEDPGRVRTADALVTRRRDVAVAMMVADCLPVLLSDPVAGVIGAAHAGRRGLLDGILEAAVAAACELGATPQGLSVVIGPAICGRCYEVPEAMRRDAAARLPGCGATTRDGTPGIDLVVGAHVALERTGIPPAQVRALGTCTLEDPGLFSYRRDGVTGRQVGVIRRA